jgi:23S rRNA (adenine2503-C2)-methyltransferase
MYIDISKYNLPEFRQRQLNEAIFKNLVGSIDEITTIPKDLKEKIKKDFLFPSIKVLKEVKNSEVIKKAFKTIDGKTFESVLILHEKRNTVCVSSQIGCSVGCKFCATGNFGLERNLNYQEIVDQVLFFARFLKEKGENITNIVFMGMGEPFLNLENVEKSLEILTSLEGMNFSPRRITVSTIWVGNQLVDFAKKFPQVNIAISLHSVIQEKRQSLVPLAKHVSVKDIGDGIKEYFKVSNRRLTLEYLMLKGVNDQRIDAEELVKFIKEINLKLLHVNLLTYNRTNHEFNPSDSENLISFKNFLQTQGINVTTRKSMGEDIESACGMLKERS